MGVWIDAGVTPKVTDRRTDPALSCRHASLSSCPVRFEAPSAALDVLLNDHAAVSEERAGQRLQERPRVGAGVKRLHVAERRTFAAHYSSGGVDLPVQDGGAANRGLKVIVWISEVQRNCPEQLVSPSLSSLNDVRLV